MDESFEASLIDVAESELKQRRAVENWNRCLTLPPQPKAREEAAAHLESPWLVAAGQIFSRTCVELAFRSMEAGEPAPRMNRRLADFAERLSQRLWDVVRAFEPFTAFSLKGASPTSKFHEALIQRLPKRFCDAQTCYAGGGHEWRHMLSDANRADEVSELSANRLTAADSSVKPKPTDEMAPPSKEAESTQLEAGTEANTTDKKVLPRRKRSGRKADAENNRNVVRVLKVFGPGWRDQLHDICGVLDQEKVPLPRSKKWEKEGCSDWTDVLSADREGLVKALQHRLDWVSKHPLDSQDAEHRG